MLIGRSTPPPMRWIRYYGYPFPSIVIVVINTCIVPWGKMTSIRPTIVPKDFLPVKWQRIITSRLLLLSMVFHKRSNSISVFLSSQETRFSHRKSAWELFWETIHPQLYETWSSLWNTVLSCCSLNVIVINNGLQFSFLRRSGGLTA